MTRESKICGYDAIKKEIDQLIALYNDPTLANAKGITLPKGIMLVGEPGNGKTKLARYFIKKCKRRTFYFHEMTEIHRLFRKARAAAPAIVFIDEFDKYVFQNSLSIGAMLGELDGAIPNTGVVVLACSSEVYRVDDALLRPGRFDRVIHIPNPGLTTRQEIAESALRHSRLAAGVTGFELARLSGGYSCAEVASLCQSLSLVAYENGHEEIQKSDVEIALERVSKIGEGYPVEIEPSASLERVAAHEAGHVIAALAYTKRELVYKASIIPTGDISGYVRINEDESQTNLSERELRNQCVIELAGLAAQEVLFGSKMTGAAQDLDNARMRLLKTIRECGLYSVGLTYGKRDYEERGEQSKEKVDSLIGAILEESYAEALAFLKTNRPLLAEFQKRLLSRKICHAEDWADLYPHLLGGAATTGSRALASQD